VGGTPETTVNEASFLEGGNLRAIERVRTLVDTGLVQGEETFGHKRGGKFGKGGPACGGIGD